MPKQGAERTEPPAITDGHPAIAMPCIIEGDPKRFGWQLFVGFRHSVRIVPGHPVLGIFPNKTVVFLKGGEILESIDFSQAAGVDQAHEQIADESASFGLEEQRIFPMEDGPF